MIQLIKSRKFIPPRSFVYESEVQSLVAELERVAAEKGLTVSRWQTNSNCYGWISTIRWFVHRGPRPARSTILAAEDIVDFVELYALEGTSVHCRAYRELSKMLERVKEFQAINPTNKDFEGFVKRLDAKDASDREGNAQ